MIDQKELDIRFRYHQPNPESIEKMQQIRQMAKDLAELIVSNTPTSREQSLALTKLEECVMHANSGIARRDPD